MTDIAERVREACEDFAARKRDRSRLLAEEGYSRSRDEKCHELEADAFAAKTCASLIRALDLPDDPRDAEIKALREALRRHAIPTQDYCYECGGEWNHESDTEHHTPGCLAAPEAAP